MAKPEIQQITETEGKGLRQLLAEMKVALDEHDRLMRFGLFDDPRIAEQDRVNSLPEPAGDATGKP